MDRRLVERCIAGEPDAWNILTRDYTRRVSAKVSQVYRRCMGRNATRAEAEEVAQEVFVKLARDDARALRRFGWRCSLSTYILTIAASRAVDRLRRDARSDPRAGLRIGMEKAKETLPSEEPDPLLAAVGSERDEGIRRAVSALSDRDALVVRMYYWKGMTLGRIAQALGITPDYACVVLQRALQKIRKNLGGG